MDRVTWLKTLWQYNFKSPAHLRRMNFIVHYQKFKEFWIWKYVAKIFLIFQAFFINLWSRGKHSWLWNQGSCVQIPAVPFLFLNENAGWAGIRTRGLQIQSQLCLPLDHQDWSFDAKKFQSNFPWGGVMTTPCEGESSVKYAMVNRVNGTQHINAPKSSIPEI